ncbi:glyoxalase [Cryptosporangium sp. NPDC051539]|uniref:glyoxalase n=1 Tax=Cryptosporangium sp. NPDC051539 TaxID=3363962 RepID=UPI0037AF24E9
MIDHVQVSCPAGSEGRVREFYAGVLGWDELPKPPLLAARGGCWFAVPGGGELHVGVEPDFRPARKAHPAFVVDVDAVAAVLTAAGQPVTWADPREIPGRRRFHTTDAVGNRLEFLDGATQRRGIG